MSAPREGQRVSYVGDESDLKVGDRGKVLSSAGTGSHVLWATGARQGEITLTANMDLVAARTVSYEHDSLDSGGLVTIAVREVYDHGGEAGLLNALNEEGHLATFAPIAEEALSMVASRIRQDPSMIEVLSQLDEDEGAELVSLASFVLLRDAFGGAA